jgi:hypothetical protein
MMWMALTYRYLQPILAAPIVAEIAKETLTLTMMWMAQTYRYLQPILAGRIVRGNGKI